MKKSKITFLVASLLCLGMGIGSAFAITYTGAHKQHGGALDDAIVLYWGSGNSELQIAGVEDLVAGTNQYRYFACEPAMSTNVTGTVTITYTIAGSTQGETTYSLDGLKVKVYQTASLQNDETRNLEGLEPVATLDYDVEASRTTTTSFLVGGENASKAYYCLEFVYDGSQSSGDAWGGRMTISQGYAA